MSLTPDPQESIDRVLLRYRCQYIINQTVDGASFGSGASGGCQKGTRRRLSAVTQPLTFPLVPKGEGGFTHHRMQDAEHRTLALTPKALPFEYNGI